MSHGSVPKKKVEIKQKFKMVNTLRLGLSKFDEVIKPEAVKLKKAFDAVDNQSRKSSKSINASVNEDKNTIRVFKNDLGSHVSDIDDFEGPSSKPKLITKKEEVVQPVPVKKEEEKKGLFGDYSFAKSQEEGSKDSVNQESGLAGYKFSVASIA